MTAGNQPGHSHTGNDHCRPASRGRRAADRSGDPTGSARSRRPTCPDPTGLFQLSLGLLSLEEQAFCTALEVGLCITQQLLHRRHSPRRDDINRDRLLLGSAVDHGSGQFQGVDNGLQETAALAEAVDQPDVGAWPALQQDRQHDAREARAGAEIGPGQRLGREIQKLGAVPGVAVPEIGDGVRPDQVHDLVRLDQHSQEGRQVGDVGVAGPAEAEHLDLLQTRHGVEEGQLSRVRHRGGDAVGIDLDDHPAFGFDEDLVAGFLGEAHHLVFDGRAVARTAPGQPAAIDRAFAEVISDDAVRLFGRVGHAAGDLRHGDAVGQEAEGHGLVVRRLHLQPLPGDGAAVQSRGRAGLQPAHHQLRGVQVAGQARRGILAITAGRNAQIAAMDDAVEEGASRQHHSAGADGLPRPGRDADHPVAVQGQPLGRARHQGQVGIVRQFGLHSLTVQAPVDLAARAAHGGALGPVQHAKLNARHVGQTAHEAVEGVDLADQMALAQTADGRVTAHLADGLELVEGGEDLAQDILDANGTRDPSQGVSGAPQVVAGHFRRQIERPAALLDSGQSLGQAAAMAFARDGREVSAGQVARQPGRDPLMQFGQPLPRRRADAQGFEVRRRRHGAQIGLVQHLKIGGAHEGGGRVLGAFGGGRADPQAQIGALGARTGAADALSLDRIVAVAQTGRVRQGDGVTADHDVCVQHVPRRSSDGGDDGRFARDQGVKQGRLARVGLADQDDAIALAHPPPAIGIGQGRAKIGRQSVQHRPGRARQIVRHFLVREVDLGLDQRQGLQQVAAESGVGRGQGAVELAQGLRFLGVRFSVDEVSDRLGLGQIHAAVLKGATGELARLGGTQAERDQGGAGRLDDGAAAVQVQLGRVLAGIGARGDEAQYQGLVDQTAVVAQAAHRGQPRRQPLCPQRCQGRLRAWTRQAQDGDGAAARRRGEGEDG
uniref:PE-PGRS family protein n=1 Tax=Parastrongyloides trichosuri TaxID=131310 RepID=A0A0N5A6W0_PARTI